MEEALWTAHVGRVNLADLAPYCVIDRCAASIGDLEFRTRGGGQRIYGKRPLTPERSTIEAQQGFFDNLKASLQAEGQKLRILLWGINGKLFTRYGASRIYCARELGWKKLEAVLCSFDPPNFMHKGFEYDFAMSHGTTDPIRIMEWFAPRSVGSFECSHERLDGHRMEPWGYDSYDGSKG